MARFILIDNNSGHIFGDTADINGRSVACADPIAACRIVDEQLAGEHGREYEDVSRLDDAGTGYFVYRADINGSEAVAVVEDGQDPEMIAAVEQDCQLVATVRCFSPER